jgi:hypothetical protein
VLAAAITPTPAPVGDLAADIVDNMSERRQIAVLEMLQEHGVDAGRTAGGKGDPCGSGESSCSSSSGSSSAGGGSGSQSIGDSSSEGGGSAALSGSQSIGDSSRGGVEAAGHNRLATTAVPG